MANDKNFKIKNGLQAGRYLQTGGTETAGSEGYNLEGADYDSVSFSVASQDGVPRSIIFNNDGTKMYVLGSGNDRLYQYSLSTAYDLSTASYDTFKGVQDAIPTSVAFNNDGTKLYTLGITSDNIYQYSLSTAFDISTLSYDSVSFSINAQSSVADEILFNDDGTKLYMLASGNDSIFQYSLSTAFDISTLSYDSVSFSVTSQDTSPFGMTFNNNGTKLYVCGSQNDSVYQYSLSTAYDLNTLAYDSISFNVSSQETTPRGISFNADGTKMYMVGSTNGTIYQYSTVGYTQTLDLSTGHYFDFTLSGNTRIELSNPPASGVAYAAQIEVTGTVFGYDVVDSAYDNVKFNLAAQSTSVQSIAFNNAGTKFYAGGNDNKIYQYTLSTAWDVSTATYDNISLSISGGLYHLEFKPDGTKLYYLATTSVFYEYNLTTPFDISTAVYSTNSFSVNTQTGTGARSATFKTDGTKMYAMSPTNDTVFQYSLSTAWDVSTASYDSISKSVATEISDNRTIQFTDDGTKMYICDSSSDKVFQYTLSTAWDVSTASYDNLSVSVNVASTMLTPEAFKLSKDNDFFYVYGSSYRNVVRFATTQIDATLTWPDSIKWDLGAAAPSPDGDSKDMYALLTIDGGTTYYGKGTGENMS